MSTDVAAPAAAAQVAEYLHRHDGQTFSPEEIAHATGVAPEAVGELLRDPQSLAQSLPPRGHRYPPSEQADPGLAARVEAALAAHPDWRASRIATHTGDTKGSVEGYMRRHHPDLAPPRGRAALPKSRRRRPYAESWRILERFLREHPDERFNRYQLAAQSGVSVATTAMLVNNKMGNQEPGTLFSAAALLAGPPPPVTDLPQRAVVDRVDPTPADPQSAPQSPPEPPESQPESPLEFSSWEEMPVTLAGRTRHGAPVVRDAAGQLFEAFITVHQDYGHAVPMKDLFSIGLREV